MIKSVIKRDGTVEEFDASKLNKWGEWASENLEHVDWSSVVLDAVSMLGEKVKTTDLQSRLIKTCLENDTWQYNLMAGRLYAADLYRLVHNLGLDNAPTVFSVHGELINLGLMVDLGYTEHEYALIEEIIDHSIDLNSTYFELHQTVTKYGIRDRKLNKLYETQQYMYIRMAMALAAERFTGDEKMEMVKRFYNAFSQNKLNAPTPNHVNLGTELNGYASCCTYTTDDSAKSLAIGDHIAYTMTYMSAGIGSHLKTRSLGDAVRSGSIIHQGKLPYLRSLVGAKSANLQNGRGGAVTEHFTVYDPEIKVLLELKNPMSTEDKKIRGLDYSLGTNKVFAKAVALDQDIALFSYADEPELYESQYESLERFKELYEKYLAKPTQKTFVRARDLIITSMSEAYETGRSYLHWTDELNRHTPHKDKIYSSNLCQETAFPTKPYNNMMDLYSSEDHGRGEIGLCSLAAVNVGNVETDEEYENITFLALLMIDICIYKSHYELPHLEVTAKARMSAGVGMVGLAYRMAKEGVKYSTQDGRNFIHELAETHAYYLYKASLKLGKMYGNAKWMHKTKWPDGWNPTKTYNKKVDEVVTIGNKRDWDSLSAEIVANGGIRNSVCINYMPSEASSKSSGTTNGVYPIRDLTLIKTDDSSVTYWAAPEGERLKDNYELAWDVPTHDLIDDYAIIQKWTDQGLSADLYRRIIGSETISSEEMIGDYLHMTKRGLKSRYYQNSKTSEGVETAEDDKGCPSGFCTL